MLHQLQFQWDHVSIVRLPSYQAQRRSARRILTIPFLIQFEECGKELGHSHVASAIIIELVLKKRNNTPCMLSMNKAVDARKQVRKAPRWRAFS